MVVVGGGRYDDDGGGGEGNGLLYPTPLFLLLLSSIWKDV